MSIDYPARSDGDGSDPFEYIPDETTPTSIAVVRAIAAVENVDPIDLDFTLYEYVDPQALDQLTGRESADDTEVTFTANGYRVRVHDTGEITLRETD